MSLILSPAPHVRTKNTTQRLMLNVVISLLPCAAAGIYYFGLRAAIVLAVSVVSAVLAELGYHDNLEDEAWITGNIEPIAAALVESVCEYFGLPFLQPMERQEGTVILTSGALNLRAAPSYDAPVYLQIPNGETVTVWGEYDNWYVVEYDGTFGYVRGESLRLNGESPVQPR